MAFIRISYDETMAHVLLLFWIISFSIGFTTLIAIILIYYRYKNRTLKYYILQMLCLSVLVVTSGLKQYNDLNLPFISEKTLIYLDSISLTGNAFIPMFTILFATSFFTLKYNKVIYSISVLLTLFFLAGLLITFLFFKDTFPFINFLYFLFLTFSIVLSVLIVFLNFKKIKVRLLRSYLLSLFIIGILAFMAFLADLVIHFEDKTTLITSSFRIGAVLYLLWNLLTIIYFIKYIFSKEIKITRENYLLFFNKYNITEREKEVILLIIQGKNNNQIAENLFISTGTVKRHIHNIFEKCDAKTRMELVHLISNS